MDEHRIDAAREHLIERRVELLQLMSASEASRKPVEPEQTTLGRLSRMDALQQQAMALEAEQRRGFELKRIDAALRRIDEGAYGYCVTCGDAIAPKRLELDPTAPTCIKCARAAER